MKSNRRGPQYGKWATLRASNVDYVAGLSGMSREKLLKLLRTAKDKGVYELKIPLNTDTFTREE